MDHSVWFESWDSLFKILMSSVIGYLTLILFVRIAGKRSTSKMNNFDWIVTVAVGSVLASMAVLKDVTIADGVLAMGLLLGFQLLLTTATSRSELARELVLSKPSVLYAHGEFHQQELLKQRVWKGEILSAVRENGAGSLDDVEIVTFEPDAEISIVQKSRLGSFDAVTSIRGYRDTVDEPNRRTGS